MAPCGASLTWPRRNSQGYSIVCRASIWIMVTAAVASAAATSSGQAGSGDYAGRVRSPSPIPRKYGASVGSVAEAQGKQPVDDRRAAVAAPCASTPLTEPSADGAMHCAEAPVAHANEAIDGPAQYHVHYLDMQHPWLGALYGHYVVLDNPIGHFSFVPPAGGCGGGFSTVANSSAHYAPPKRAGSPSAARRRVQQVARSLEAAASAAGCVVATNAGFFNTTSSACYGNLVSDGQVLARSSRRNAHFGIRNGRYVAGYLTPDDDPADFDQLIGGVVWLVRNGTSYVDESFNYLEDMSVQESGGGDTFVTIQSARTAVGHDESGRLVVFQVEGRSWVHGVDLRTFADLLIQAGVVNAVNLDGGSSATMVEGTTIVNYPAADCEPESDLFRCPRGVTSITCMHNAGGGASSGGTDDSPHNNDRPQVCNDAGVETSLCSSLGGCSRCRGAFDTCGELVGAVVDNEGALEPAELLACQCCCGCDAVLDSDNFGTTVLVLSCVAAAALAVPLGIAGYTRCRRRRSTTFTAARGSHDGVELLEETRAAEEGKAGDAEETRR